MKQNPPTEIVLHLENVSQLFYRPDTEDPILNLELDSGMDIIIEQVSENGKAELDTVFILVPEKNIELGSQAWAKKAIQKYCAYQIAKNEKNIKTIRQNGRRQLGYGILFFLVCLAVSAALIVWAGNSPSQPVKFVGYFLGTILVIAVSVVVWNPVEALMYNWRPLDRQNKVLRKIQSMDVSVRPAPTK